MGWLDEQIKQRKRTDQEILEDAFSDVASAVLGNRTAGLLKSACTGSGNAVNDILKYFGYKPAEQNEETESFEEMLEYVLRPYGILYRSVSLDEFWYKQAYGPILGFTAANHTPVALIPGSWGGYRYTDPETGQTVKLNRKTAGGIEDAGICFYRPLPLKQLKIRDLLVYLKGCLAFSDLAVLTVLTVILAGIGLILPRITRALTGPVLDSGNLNLLVSLAVFTVFTVLSQQLFSAAQTFASAKITAKTSLAVEAAVMARLLSLPASFFRKYSSGELYKRAKSVNTLCRLLTGFMISAAFTSVSSLLHIGQIAGFVPSLVISALIITAVTVALSTGISLLQIRISTEQMKLSAEGSGLLYALIAGIRKIKLAGAEKRAFSKWLSHYAKEAEYLYDPPAVLKAESALLLAVSLIGNIVLYWLAVRSGVGQSDYLAFNMSYGLLMGALSSLAGTALSFAKVKPVMEMAEPILNEKPEPSEDREILTKLRGKIELNHVSFRYDGKGPNVIDDLTLKIRPGEYIAVVGKTGCGKSTLMRLLLGFEKPQKGAIYYDDRDIEKIDLKSLRRRIGTVLQTGSLFQGDIYSNIAIASGYLSVKDAWKAAETAGIAEDIRKLPMGMNTYISEGQGGISGGQKQRLMIARAIASKPKILLFDEATSALDNVTQKRISEALDGLDCTRVIIAHRLSTIRRCDRILVLENGKISEEGTYDELIRRNGLFAELVDRQRLDKE